MKCEECGTELVNDACPKCGLNKCMDDKPWKQEIKNEDRLKK